MYLVRHGIKGQKWDTKNGPPIIKSTTIKY